MSEGARRDEPGWYLVVDPASEGLRVDAFIAGRVERLHAAVVDDGAGEVGLSN